MSKDLLHQQEWEREHPEVAIAHIVELSEPDLFQIMRWSCGNGWQVSHVDLTIEEAREIKKRYLCTNTQAKIFLEVE